jgi:calcium-dependent protein kinase
LLESTNIENLSIKITDFGFACFFNPSEGLRDVLGSPLYMAPEIIKEKKYDYRVDVWSTGVIAYILLCGRPPFRGRAKAEIFNSIENTPLKFDHPVWEKLSKESKEFISWALEKDYTKRPTAKQLLDHEWIRKMIKEPDLK